MKPAYRNDGFVVLETSEPKLLAYSKGVWRAVATTQPASTSPGDVPLFVRSPRGLGQIEFFAADLYVNFIPAYTSIQRALQAGSLPFWNPYLGCDYLR